MEKVLVIKRENIPEDWLKKKVSISLDFEKFLSIFKGNSYLWIEREKAENNPNYKQIIPYAITVCNEKVLLYKRAGTEKRLHNLYSIGIGGHIDFADKDKIIRHTIIKGLFRELSEEFINFSSKNCSINFLGIINEEISSVGRVHLGLVFYVKLKEFLEGNRELVDFQWVDFHEIKYYKLEHWSLLAFELLKKEKRDRYENILSYHRWSKTY